MGYGWTKYHHSAALNAVTGLCFGSVEDLCLVFAELTDVTHVPFQVFVQRSLEGMRSATFPALPSAFASSSRNVGNTVITLKIMHFNNINNSMELSTT
jgi:hypothetical protein